MIVKHWLQILSALLTVQSVLAAATAATPSEARPFRSSSRRTPRVSFLWQ
jgi:hypothetical protein